MKRADYFYMQMRTILFFTVLAVILTGCSTLSLEISRDTDDFMEKYEQVGKISAEKTCWNWLFLKSKEERSTELKDILTEKARNEYGEDAVISLETAEGQWSPASLLMLFSLLGFVEEASMEAAVWKPAPEGEPEISPVEYGFRYAVIPDENYADETGFMIVEYKTRDQLVQELSTLFENSDIDENTYKKRQSRLPETGQIFVTLGREEITNAISRWFTFSCVYNDKTLFRKKGTEDIPYVYGTDKFWWNDLNFKVNTEWEGRLRFTVEDNYRNETYYFSIVRERYIIEPAE